MNFMNEILMKKTNENNNFVSIHNTPKEFNKHRVKILAVSKTGIFFA